MIVVSISANPTLADTPPPIPAHHSTYVVLYNGKPVGEIEFILEKANESVWYVKTETRATSFLAKTLGSEVTEASHFYWQNQAGRDQLIPLTYHHVSREPLRTRFWQHHYDWENESTQTITHQGEQTIQIHPGILDPLTLRLQLAADLANSDGNNTPTLEDRNYWVLDRDDVESQRIEARVSETVEVPAGCFDALKFYRFRKEGSSRNYDLWVSQALAWLPVKMVYQEGNREIQFELISSDLIEESPECLSSGIN